MKVLIELENEQKKILVADKIDKVKDRDSLYER